MSVGSEAVFVAVGPEKVAEEGEAAEAPSPAVSEAQPGEESAEEIGRRIAAQWTHDPEAAPAEVFLYFLLNL